MRKRIHLVGMVDRGDTGPVYVDVEENLVRYENDGVSVLRVRAGTPERWFPNWRVIEVADAPTTGRVEGESPTKLVPFEPYTPEDLGYRTPFTETAEIIDADSEDRSTGWAEHRDPGT